MTNLPNYLKRRVEAIKYPALLITHEKHGTFYYLLSDVEGLWRTCLSLVAERKEAGWYAKPGKPPKMQKTVNDEAFAQLADHLKVFEQRIRNENKEAMKSYEDEVEIWTAIERVLMTEDGQGALMVLDARKDWEYERFEIIQPEVV